jgi:hypothetical protein
MAQLADFLFARVFEFFGLGGVNRHARAPSTREVGDHFGEDRS